MKQRQVEVLAPAGSFESMKAAIAAGADAVYIGVSVYDSQYISKGKGAGQSF